MGKNLKEKELEIAELGYKEIKQLILDKKEDIEEIALLRKEIYVDLPSQKLLRKLLEENEKDEIIPTYDPSSGFRYKIIESVFDKNVPIERAEELLERLTKLKILKRKFYDTVSTCPSCKSPSITLHYYCPNCNSHNITKTSLTEHIPCGNIDEKERYIKSGQNKTCPKCGARLVKGEYKNMGLWYICRKCKEKFEHPGLDLICRNCNNNFKVRTAFVKEIPKYYLNPDIVQEIRQNVTSLESIYSVLNDLGFIFEISPTAVGQKSRMKHSFSLLAKKRLNDLEIVSAIDHAVDDIEVNASTLILFLYKISEVKVDLPIFVAIPKMSIQAKRIAEGYNIIVVEGVPKEKEKITDLKERIQEKLTKIVTETSKKN